MTGTKHYFTVEQANHALPLVRSIVADIVALYNDLNDRHERLQAVKRQNTIKRGTMPAEYVEELDQMEKDLQADAERLNQYISELQQLGVELKDVSKGLVDFPAMQDGREICLCWMHGEPELSYWHEIEAGFAGRQSLMAGSAPSSVDNEGPLSA